MPSHKAKAVQSLNETAQATRNSQFSPNPNYHPHRHFHVAQEGRPRTARKPNVPLRSYVLPSPAPASAAAFLTEIGIRPFSQNTYQTQSNSSQTPAPSLPLASARSLHHRHTKSSRSVSWLPTTEDGETGKLGAPLGQTESSQSRLPPPGPRAPVREE